MATTIIPRPEREEQALREAGSTVISPAAKTLLTLLFLATLAAVPLLQAMIELRAPPAAEGAHPGARLAKLLAELPAAARVAGGEGPLAANRRLREAVETFETAVEDDSVLRRWVLPPAQSVLTGLLGAGNEQAYPGRSGWLFYRADFDHVTGPGFLEPEVQRRRQAADPGAAPPHPDPLPAILALDADLRSRGIRLVVLPVPVKPEIQPAELAPRAVPRGALRNPSYADFVRRLEAAGIDVFDPAPSLLAARRRTGEPQYLRTDTHWTPGGMEALAADLAAWLDQRIDWAGRPQDAYRRRAARVESQGDIAVMLRLPDPAGLFPPQQLEISRVLTPDGRPWRSDRSAEILLLGDSFTNIYSDASLGWGSGAGLAEQLSFHLARPVDRIAVNAGGAWASRQALARALSGGEGRLADKRVVVYQFATRELSAGDWRPIAWPARGSR